MTKSKKLYKKEAERLTRDDNRDLGKFEMRPRDPYQILGIKKVKENLEEEKKE